MARRSYGPMAPVSFDEAWKPAETKPQQSKAANGAVDAPNGPTADNNTDTPYSDYALLRRPGEKADSSNLVHLEVTGPIADAIKEKVAKEKAASHCVVDDTVRELEYEVAKILGVPFEKLKYEDVLHAFIDRHAAGVAMFRDLQKAKTMLAEAHRNGLLGGDWQSQGPQWPG